MLWATLDAELRRLDKYGGWLAERECVYTAFARHARSQFWKSNAKKNKQFDLRLFLGFLLFANLTRIPIVRTMTRKPVAFLKQRNSVALQICSVLGTVSDRDAFDEICYLE